MVTVDERQARKRIISTVILAYHNEAWAVFQACRKGGEFQRRPCIGYLSEVYGAGRLF